MNQNDGVQVRRCHGSGHSIEKQYFRIICRDFTTHAGKGAVWLSVLKERLQMLKRGQAANWLKGLFVTLCGFFFCFTADGHVVHHGRWSILRRINQAPNFVRVGLLSMPSHCPIVVWVEGACLTPWLVWQGDHRHGQKLQALQLVVTGGCLNLAHRVT